MVSWVAAWMMLAGVVGGCYNVASWLLEQHTSNNHPATYWQTTKTPLGTITPNIISYQPPRTP